MAQPLRPTLKERKRYIVYEPARDEKVMNAYQELFGTVGRAHAGLQTVTKKGDKSILRVAHNHVDNLKAAILHAGAKSVLTTGTLEKAKEAL